MTATDVAASHGLSKDDDTITLYRLPDAKGKKQTAIIHDARKAALQRFVTSRHDDKVFGAAPSPQVRRAIRLIVKDCFFEICSRKPPHHADACRPRNIVLIPQKYADIFGELEDFDVSRDEIFDRVLLPFNESKNCYFIPTSNGHEITLPINKMSKKELQRISKSYAALSDAVGSLATLHRDHRSYAKAACELKDGEYQSRCHGSP